MALSAVACLAQTNPLDLEHTKTISIPMTAGVMDSWKIEKVHLHRGEVLVAHTDHISNFQDKHNILDKRKNWQKMENDIFQ
jgi:hypothetical protein